MQSKGCADDEVVECFPKAAQDYDGGAAQSRRQTAKSQGGRQGPVLPICTLPRATLMMRAPFCMLFSSA